MRALVLLLLAALPAFAQEKWDWRGPFTGTVAGQPAVALLRAEGDFVVSGLYFYRRSGRDIAIEPEGAPGRFKECAASDLMPEEPCDEPTGRWDVKLAGGKLTGTWHPPSGGPGRPVALTLEPTKGDAIEAYAARRFDDNRVSVVRAERLGPARWNVVRESRSGATGRVLTTGGTEAARKRINAELAAMLNEAIGIALAGAKAAIENDRIVFANERLLALTREHHVWGGAHPSMGFEAITWDLATGERVAWPKRLRFHEPGPLDLKRRDLLAALALERMTEEEKDAKAREDKDWCHGIVLEAYGCKENRCTMKSGRFVLEPTHWSVWPTAVGLAIAADVYNEAERGCRGEAVVIPWERVRGARIGNEPLP